MDKSGWTPRGLRLDSGRPPLTPSRTRTRPGSVPGSLYHQLANTNNEVPLYLGTYLHDLEPRAASVSAMPLPKYESHGRLLAKIVRDLLRTDGPFETIADVTDALKSRCRRLGIGWNNESINEAYRLIESNTPLRWPTPRPAAGARRHDEAVTAAEAGAILATIRARLGVAPTIRRVPAAKPLTRGRAAQLKAAAFVLQEIDESLDRCRALETADPERPTE